MEEEKIIKKERTIEKDRQSERGSSTKLWIFLAWLRNAERGYWQIASPDSAGIYILVPSRIPKPGKPQLAIILWYTTGGCNRGENSVFRLHRTLYQYQYTTVYQPLFLDAICTGLALTTQWVTALLLIRLMSLTDNFGLRTSTRTLTNRRVLNDTAHIAQNIPKSVRNISYISLQLKYCRKILSNIAKYFIAKLQFQIFKYFWKQINI